MSSDATFLNAGSVAYATDRTPIAPSVLPSNPFVGLRPFESEESVLFFGRDKQVVDLMQQLHSTRFLAVVGSSGCGKSSLIRAGLIPKLKAGFLVERRDRWSIVIMKPGDAPLANMAAALLGAASEPPSEEEVSALVSTMRVKGAGAVVERLGASLEHDGASLLLLVDQFEELFRYGDSSSSDDRQAVTSDDLDPSNELVVFAAEERRRGQEAKRILSRNESMRLVSIMLQLALQREVPVYVVMTMRSDFLGECDAFHGLPEAINECIYMVPRLNRQQRQEAAENPVRLYGQTVSSRLLDRVVNDVGDEPDQLPVMQHALMRTWEEWKKDHREGEGIDLRHYEAAGTFSGALSNDANDALDEMQPEERLIAERMFQALVDTDAQGRRVRRPAHLSELMLVTNATQQQVLDVIDHFRRSGRCFLTLSGERTTDPLVDISHESFIRQWDKLSDWINAENESKEQYTRLASAAVRYQAGISTTLWTDPELQSALNWWDERVPTAAWASRYDPAFDTAQDFLNDSKAKREADERERARRQLEEIESGRLKQQNRRLRRLTFALVFISLLAAVGGAVAILGFSRARQSEKRADMERGQANEAKQKAEGLAGDLQKSLEQAQRAKAHALRAEERAKEETLAATKAREDLRIASENQRKALDDAQKKLLGELGANYQQALSAGDDEASKEASKTAFDKLIKLYQDNGSRPGEASTKLLFAQFQGKQGVSYIESSDDRKRKRRNYYDALQEFDPNDAAERGQRVSILVNMGDLAYGSGKPDDDIKGAVGDYEQALKEGNNVLPEGISSRSRPFDIFRRLGDFYRSSEKPGKAADYYDSAISQLEADIKNGKSVNDLWDANLIADSLVDVGRLRRQLGQTGEAEKAYRKLAGMVPKDLNHITRADSLIAIGEKLNQLDERQWRMDVFETALNLYKEQKDVSGLAKTYQGLGTWLTQLAEAEKDEVTYEDAVKYLVEAERLQRDIVKSPSNPFIVDNSQEILLKIGEIQVLLGQAEEAQRTYQKLMNLAHDENKNDHKQEARVLIDIGQKLNQPTERQRQLVFFEKALSLFRERNDNAGLADSYQAIGSWLSGWGLNDPDYQGALKYLLEAERLQRDSVHDQKSLLVILQGLGYVYGKLNMKPEAIKSYQAAQPLCEQQKDDYYCADNIKKGLEDSLKP